MSKHTPGPWFAYELAPEDPSWGACEIWPAENDREDEECSVKPVATMVIGVENARLIAAAPDMLDALVGVIEHMEWSSELGEVAYQHARTAIAKATGQ